MQDDQGEYSDFKPEGMEEWEEEQSEERIKEADMKLKTIVSEMRKYIFDVFRRSTRICIGTKALLTMLSKPMPTSGRSIRR